MIKRVMVVFVVVFVSVFFVSAQQIQPRNRNQPAVRPKIDFSVEPAKAPEDKLNVNEFQLKRKDLEEKVIELEFDRVSSFKQTDSGYTAKVTFEDPRDSAGVMVLVPEEGRELFEAYSSQDARYRRRETVLVEVLSANVVRAVGVRYRGSKPDGERYSW